MWKRHDCRLKWGKQKSRRLTQKLNKLPQTSIVPTLEPALMNSLFRLRKFRLHW